MAVSILPNFSSSLNRLFCRLDLVERQKLHGLSAVFCVKASCFCNLFVDGRRSKQLIAGSTRDINWRDLIPVHAQVRHVAGRPPCAR